jgi:DHA1 family bicyclomycin/chloramphenicol resistance-like MFS transporter
MTPSFAKIMILITVMLMDILGGAEIDLFVPSFPELKSHFNISTFLLEALLSVNFAGSCFGLLFIGGLADRYGRKPVILAGLGIFVCASMLCLSSSSYNIVLLGRFFQGVGIIAPATLCYLIIADSYSIKKQQYLMGILNGLMNVAVAGAPVLGSYITMYFHWQGNFIALLVMGIIVLLMTMVFIPPTKISEYKEPIALSGYTTIFKSSALMLLILNIVFMYVPYWIFLGMSPILYIRDLGVSLSHYGYYQGAWALVFALGSIFFGLIVNKYSARKMLYLAFYICIFGTGLIALVSFLDIKNPLIIALSLLPFSVGSIIPNVILYPIALNFMPQLKGRASSLIKGIMLILSAIGLEFVGLYYQGSFQNIGIVITGFNLVALVTLILAINNHEIKKLL